MGSRHVCASSWLLLNTVFLGSSSSCLTSGFGLLWSCSFLVSLLPTFPIDPFFCLLVGVAQKLLWSLGQALIFTLTPALLALAKADLPFALELPAPQGLQAWPPPPCSAAPAPPWNLASELGLGEAIEPGHVSWPQAERSPQPGPRAPPARSNLPSEIPTDLDKAYSTRQLQTGKTDPSPEQEAGRSRTGRTPAELRSSLQ